MLPHHLWPLCLILLALPQVTLARGRGTQSYLVTSDGQLAASLGETRGELLDPAGFVRIRYREGRVTAAPLDKPDEVLWSAAVKPRFSGREPDWQLWPDLLLVMGEDSLTGIDPGSGKIRYATPAGGFTENLSLLRYPRTAAEPSSLYLMEDRALREAKDGEQSSSAALARFDLASGKFLWKTSIVNAAGKMFRPVELDPRGVARGPDEGENFYFDPATGKALDKAPFEDTPRVSAAPLPRAKTPDDKIEFRDDAGRLLWTRHEPGQKSPPLRAGDTLIVATVTDRSTVTLVALNIKDGAERWRRPMPGGFFADSVTVEVRAAKQGYLVQVNWLVLD